MFIRTPLAICFLATSLAAAQCLPKTGSKVSDEVISTIFGEGDSRGCEARRGDCVSLIQNSLSEPNGELLRSSSEGAKQRCCGGSLGEAGGRGGEAGNDYNHGGGLEARKNDGDDEDDRKDPFGGRNRGGSKDKSSNNDRKGPPLPPSNQPSQNQSGQAPLETQTSSQNPSPPPAATPSPVCAQSQLPRIPQYPPLLTHPHP